MPKMIQIRHVPDGLHRELKHRATAAGMTLSDYLRRELERLIAEPSWEDFLKRLDSLGPVRDPVSAVDAVHEARAERDAELEQRIRW